MRTDGGANSKEGLELIESDWEKRSGKEEERKKHSRKKVNFCGENDQEGSGNGNELLKKKCLEIEWRLWGGVEVRWGRWRRKKMMDYGKWLDRTDRTVRSDYLGMGKGKKGDEREKRI
jgi:hypothetical protein